MSEDVYPHVPAAFINAIAEEGTKAEAVQWLQKLWNENCALRKREERAITMAYDSGRQLEAKDGWQPIEKVPSEPVIGHRELAEAIATAIASEREQVEKSITEAYDAGRRDGALEGADRLAEACEPWKHCAPDPPEWDSPLMDVWQAACQWTMNIVGKTMGAVDWEGGDGSETIEGDIAAEVGNIMRSAGLVDADGDPITRDEISRLRSAPSLRGLTEK